MKSLVYSFFIFMFFSVGAHAQSEIETVLFLLDGDLRKDCSTQRLQELDFCKIEYIENSYTYTKSGYGENGQITNIKLSIVDKCKYSLSIAESGRDIQLIFDFNGHWSFSYDDDLSKRANNRSVGERVSNYYKIVRGDLVGVKKAISIKEGEKPEIKGIEDFYEVFVWVKSQDSNYARGRYEKAAAYFKDKYCSGAAF